MEFGPFDDQIDPSTSSVYKYPEHGASEHDWIVFDEFQLRADVDSLNSLILNCLIDIEQIKYHHFDGIPVMSPAVDLDVHDVVFHEWIQYDWTLGPDELSGIRQKYREDSLGHEMETFRISAGADCFVFQLERLWKEELSECRELAPRLVLTLSQCRSPINVHELKAMVSVKCSVNSYDAECMYQNEIVEEVHGAFPLFGKEFEFEMDSEYIAGCDYVRLDIDIKMMKVCDLNDREIPHSKWQKNGII